VDLGFFPQGRSLTDIDEHRWRVILLSPTEEETISNELSGKGWYSAVCDILTSQSEDQKTPPVVVPPTDWRWKWVEQTLRRLEAAVQLIHEGEQYHDIYDGQDDSGVLLPPPSRYPLVPRPRASQLIHSIPPSGDYSEPQSTNRHSHNVVLHTSLGPPYSFLIVENPERNAFSYGFGANGAGGLVLYTGFLDEVLRKHDAFQVSSNPRNPSPSFFASLFGLGRQSSEASSRSVTSPTDEQTSALATLLAHELAHLVLSHHLETLSSGSILVPTLSGMMVDFARVILFPITFLFGPFVGDALADVSKIGMGKVSQKTEACTSRKLELEADLISVRLMSLAGFSPHRAVEFWESRLDDNEALDADLQSASPAKLHNSSSSFWNPHANYDGDYDSHPIGSERVRRLKQELDRWAQARQDVLGSRSQVERP
jgi:Zn-dependent protease with chaperone function